MAVAEAAHSAKQRQDSYGKLQCSMQDLVWDNASHMLTNMCLIDFEDLMMLLQVSRNH